MFRASWPQGVRTFDLLVSKWDAFAVSEQPKLQASRQTDLRYGHARPSDASQFPEKTAIVDVVALGLMR
jgi:hypothetical protein